MDMKFIDFDQRGITTGSSRIVIIGSVFVTDIVIRSFGCIVFLYAVVLFLFIMAKYLAISVLYIYVHQKLELQDT